MPLECWKRLLWHVDGEKFSILAFLNSYSIYKGLLTQYQCGFFHAFIFFNLLISPPLGLLYLWCGLCFASKTPPYIRFSKVSMPLPDPLIAAQSARPWSVVSLHPVLSALEWTPLSRIRAFVQLAFLCHDSLTGNSVTLLPYILKRCLSIVLSHKTNSRTHVGMLSCM